MARLEAGSPCCNSGLTLLAGPTLCINTLVRPARVGQLGQSETIAACACAVLDNQSMRECCWLGQRGQLFPDQDSAVSVILFVPTPVRQGSLSKGVFERRTSTGRWVLSLLIFLDTTEFVLLRVFTLIETLIETICPKIWTKPLPKD